ncbi:hypothetical protein ALC57_11075 [Trachymyrmex cornetzi]|uniref:Uncharacterized protein n=1 Tax=Trachymyrmex cornetzi TaxID=471704 RepID=A0A195DUP0_9HYME|nr:hypothetical protein ALC57_11075 [Trachymyrmex cornetzi]
MCEFGMGNWKRFGGGLQNENAKCDLVPDIITPVEEKANPSTARVVRTTGLSALQPRSQNGGKWAKVQCTIFLRVSPSSTAPAGVH